MDVRKAIIFKQIGAKIAYYRILSGLHQVDLANKIGVGKSVLSRIERGKYNDNRILSVEVKSGGIAYREGNWIQINRFSGTEKVIDPFHVQSFAGTAGK